MLPPLHYADTNIFFNSIAPVWGGGGSHLGSLWGPKEKGKVHSNICMSMPLALIANGHKQISGGIRNSAQPMRPCMHA
jgi:hypothetical protein